MVWLKFSGEKWKKAPFLYLPNSLRLGELETPPDHILLRLGVAPVHLGLDQATVPVLLFLRLILESVTILFGLSMEDN